MARITGHTQVVQLSEQGKPEAHSLVIHALETNPSWENTQAPQPQDSNYF